MNSAQKAIMASLSAAVMSLVMVLVLVNVSHSRDISGRKPFMVSGEEYQCGKTQKQLKVDSLLEEVKKIQGQKDFKSEK